MKKNVRKAIMAAILAIMSISVVGCSKTTNTDTSAKPETVVESTRLENEAQQADSNVTVTSKDAESTEAESVANFAQIISFIISDANYDSESIDYEISLYKVCVADDTGETQFVVTSRCTNHNSGNELFAPMAATANYISPTTGETVEKKEVWYNFGTPYSAESMIEEAVAKAKDLGKDPDALGINECVVLTTTY